MHLPGFGAKRARLLYDELGIDSLEALRAAAENEQIRELQGLRGQGRGEPAARRWPPTSEGGGPAARILLSRALPVAEQIAGALREHPASDRVEITGSLRRMGDSAKDIDIIATASDPAALIVTLNELDARRVGAAERRGGRARRHPLGHEGRSAGSSRPTSSAT